MRFGRHAAGERHANLAARDGVSAQAFGGHDAGDGGIEVGLGGVEGQAVGIHAVKRLGVGPAPSAQRGLVEDVQGRAVCVDQPVDGRVAEHEHAAVVAPGAMRKHLREQRFFRGRQCGTPMQLEWPASLQSRKRRLRRSRRLAQWRRVGGDGFLVQGCAEAGSVG